MTCPCFNQKNIHNTTNPMNLFASTAFVEVNDVNQTSQKNFNYSSDINLMVKYLRNKGFEVDTRNPEIKDLVIQFDKRDTPVIQRTTTINVYKYSKQIGQIANITFKTQTIFSYIDNEYHIIKGDNSTIAVLEVCDRIKFYYIEHCKVKCKFIFPEVPDTPINPKNTVIDWACGAICEAACYGSLFLGIASCVAVCCLVVTVIFAAICSTMCSGIAAVGCGLGCTKICNNITG